jgi:hypothetical protein
MAVVSGESYNLIERRDLLRAVSTGKRWRNERAAKLTNLPEATAFAAKPLEESRQKRWFVLQFVILI